MTRYRNPWSVRLHVTCESRGTKRWWQLAIPSSPAPSHLPSLASNFLSVTPSSTVPRFRCDPASLIRRPSTRRTSACNASIFFFWMSLPSLPSPPRLRPSSRLARKRHRPRGLGEGTSPCATPAIFANHSDL